MKLSVVWRVINEWDPIDLLTNGAIDEYKYEINRIYCLFCDSDNAERFANGIYNIFLRNYGPELYRCSMEECVRVAELILNDGLIPGQKSKKIQNQQILR